MDSYLLGTPVTMTDILAVLQPLQNLFYRGLLLSRPLLLETLATLSGDLLLVLESLLHELNVLEPQLLGNDVEVTGGVHVTLDVDDLGIIEATHNLEDSIDRTNVRQKGVAQTSTGGRTAGQASNIVDGQVGRDARLGLELLAQPIIPLVGDDDAGLLGVDGSIGEIGRVAKMALGDGLEQGGFADVRKADLKESQRAACTCEQSGDGEAGDRGVLKSLRFHSSDCCQDGPAKSSPAEQPSWEASSSFWSMDEWRGRQTCS